jgi:hypothetical protein
MHPATLPVPTFTTPLQMPSPMHAAASAPEATTILDISHGRRTSTPSIAHRAYTPRTHERSRESTTTPAAHPLPNNSSIEVIERTSRPRRQSYAVGPEGYIPRGEHDAFITLPPPNGRSVPVAPNLQLPQPSPFQSASETMHSQSLVPSQPASSRIQPREHTHPIVSPVIIPPHPSDAIPGQNRPAETAAPLTAPGLSALAPAVPVERIPSDQLSISQLDLVGPPPPTRHRRSRTASVTVPQATEDLLLPKRERSQSTSETRGGPTRVIFSSMSLY